MSALAERLKQPGHGRAICRAMAAVMAGAMLAYYCIHPDLYAGQDHISILQSRRTYLIAALSLILIVFVLKPNRLSDAVNRRLSWAWFFAAPFAIYFSLLYLNADKFSINFYELNKIALIFTFVFLYLVQGLMFGLTGSIRFSVIISAVAVAVLGIANCFVISFRGMALSAADLFSVKTAMTVASEYTYEPDWYMVMELMLTFAICAISMKLRGGRMAHPALRTAILALCIVTGFGYYYICCRTDFLQEHDIKSEGFTHQLRYKQFDMLFTTLCTGFYLSVDKPEGYSVEKVQEIARPYLKDHAEEAGAGTTGSDAVEAGVGVAGGDADTTGVGIAGGDADTAGVGIAGGDAEKAGAGITGGDADGTQTAAAGTSVTPNLIVIMNESFADYTDIGDGLSLSDDCMPFIHGLTENTVKGTAYVSIFGANTPNSEYEFLTGNTMGFLPASSVGFNLFVRGEMPSVASQLKSEGYETMAIHPYRGTNYRRNIVYPQIGFDTYYTRDDFEDPEYIRSYISDRTVAERIISEFAQRSDSDQPFFCYNVTVQNHGGYTASNSNSKGVDDSIKVIDSDVDRTKTELYVNLIRSSDEMFRSLVQYFKTVDEPVAILMFGDHQPSLGDTTYEHLIGREEDCTTEELMEKYKVPFVLWANYDIEEEVIEKTSLNYLYSIVADRLELPLTGYQEYLLEMSREIPVLNALGYWDSEDSFYELQDETSPYYEKINEYNILEYNYILGKKNRYLPFFTLSEGS